MPRRSGVVAEGNAFFHVVNRGIDRMTIFPDSRFYEEFVRLLQQNLGAGAVRLHAFSLLPNHFHMLLSQRLPYAISEFMRNTCSSFAQNFNAKRGHTGHVFQDRYKPIPLADPQSILRVSWYIHQNPVRAGLVEAPELWRYGSMRQYLGLVRSGVATLSGLLDLVGGMENYERFMRTYDPSNPEQAKEFLMNPDGCVVPRPVI